VKGLTAAGALDRLGVATTAAADLGFRTGLASLLTLPAGSWALRSDLRREARLLSFYAELAAAADPTLVFSDVKAAPAIDVTRAHPLTFAPEGGRVEMLRLNSPYVARHPEVRREYARFEENGVAWAQHWRHGDRPRPTLVVIHGFGASPFWFNSRFFGLPGFYRRGYDVLLYLLPFHGVRQARLAAFSGWGLFAHGLAHLNEAILQAVEDLRLFLDHLERAGASEIVVTGLSLGGYVTSLLAGVDARPAAVIPNAPVISMDRLFRQWFPASLGAWALSQAARIDPAEVDRALRVHSPLNYEPLVPHERRMIIGGLGDRLAPPEQAEMLWEHWDRPAIHWFPGSHLVPLGRRSYLREMRSFLADVIGPATSVES
jgi:pimeloyl-ACP methyl ester carboxylesterase